MLFVVFGSMDARMLFVVAREGRALRTSFLLYKITFVLSFEPFSRFSFDVWLVVLLSCSVLLRLVQPTGHESRVSLHDALLTKTE